MTSCTHFDPITKIWRNTGSSMPDRNLNIATLLLDALARNGDKICQINANNDVHKTYGEIRKEVVRLSINLKRLLGVQTNDIITFIGKNHDTVTSLVIAAMALGAPVSTLDPNFKADEIVRMMRKTKSKYLFCDSDTIVESRKALQLMGLSIPIVTVDQPIDGAQYIGEFIMACDAEESFVPITLEDGYTHAAFICCSSGTTGNPKGVIITHALLIDQLGSKLSIPVEVRTLSYSSLSWLSGVSVLVSGIINGLTRVSTIDPFEAELALRTIERYKVMIFTGPPRYYSQLVSCPKITEIDLTSLKLAYGGGGFMPDELWRRSTELLKCPVFDAYGMTECGGMVASNGPDSMRRGTVGQLKAGASVCILDKSGNRCGPLIDGEICIRMQVPLMGYWDDAEATAELIDADGWMHTGDIGHFDADGFLCIVDRIKEIFKYNGTHVSPSELEGVLLQCPGVSEACVFGIDDSIVGILPAAAIVRIAGHPVTEKEICDFVKVKLSDAKNLRGGVYFVDNLPMTSTGKVMRRKVKEMFTHKKN